MTDTTLTLRPHRSFQMKLWLWLTALPTNPTNPINPIDPNLQPIIDTLDFYDFYPENDIAYKPLDYLVSSK